MTDGYTRAKIAYRELRSAIGPWAKTNGYVRWAGAQVGWQKPVEAQQQLLFKFEGHSFANSDIGNSYHGLIQLEPQGSKGSTILRQADFARCLVQAELDELGRIQGAINRRRPPLPSYLKKDVAQDSLLQYRQGHMIFFGYYGLRDVRELAAFIVSVVPQALERFLQGRVAQPVDDTPPHLRPKWLDTLGKPGDGG